MEQVGVSSLQVRRRLQLLLQELARLAPEPRRQVVVRRLEAVEVAYGESRSSLKAPLSAPGPAARRGTDFRLTFSMSNTGVLSHRAKNLTMLQALLSVLLIVVVIARAVNGLPTS